MPKQRYERREPTHEWSQIRPLLKDPTQIQYEIVRPIVLFGMSPKEHAEETGVSKSSLYTKANLFDQAGMASLLPPVPPPEIPDRTNARCPLQYTRPSFLRAQPYGPRRKKKRLVFLQLSLLKDGDGTQG